MFFLHDYMMRGGAAAGYDYDWVICYERYEANIQFLNCDSLD